VHQNHHDDFLVRDSKPSGLRFVSCVTKLTEGGRRGHASRSNGFLRCEASMARVSLSKLKTGGCMTTGGVCGIIMMVTSS
jgi:hypothetical protein